MTRSRVVTIAVPSGARVGALDAYLASRLVRSPLRTFARGLASTGCLLLVVAMFVVIAADGPNEAYLQGEIARGVDLELALVALPFALALARRRASGPLDERAATLLRLRAIGPATVAARLAPVALRIAALRSAAPVAVLTLVAALLSLTAPRTLAARLAAGLVLTALAALVAALLAALGLVAARVGRAWGRTLLLAALLVPSVMGAVLEGYPRAASPVGLYQIVVGAILRH